MPRRPTSHRVATHLLVATAATFDALLPAQTPELRGVWVARDGLTSRQKIVDTLDQLAAANLNLVCVNCWSRGYTIHPSDVLLQACGESQDPTFVGRDPLAEFVLEAHRRGIEVEAWFEYGFMFGWSGWFAGPNGTGPVLSANPTWIARDNTGNSQVSDGGGGFFTWAIHEHPAVRQFLIDLAVEVVDRYDVDGIQFDRVRYPSTSFGYDAVTSAAYQVATGQLPPANVNQSTWKRWRADGLIAFHANLYQAVKARRQSVRVTDAPIVMPLAYDSYLQDWPDWVTGGSIDLVYPQVYRTTLGSYTTDLDTQLAQVPLALRAKIAPGVRAITGTSTASVLGMVQANRARSLPGHVFWYAEGLYDDLPTLSANVFQVPAPVPNRPAGFRPTALEREENDPTTTATAAFLPSSSTLASGGLSRIALPFASAADEVVYTLPTPEAGLYALLVHVPAAPGLCTTTPHSIEHAAGRSVLLVDQGLGASTDWRELGTFWCLQGQTTVRVHAVPGEAVVADAVALLRSRLPSGSMVDLGGGSATAPAGYGLALHGQSRIGGSLQVILHGVPAGAVAAIGLGTNQTSLPLLGGTLQLLPDVLSAGLPDARARFATAVAVPFAPALVGLTVFAQGMLLPAAPAGAALSNAASAAIAGS